MERLAAELHKPARRHFSRRHYKLEGIGDTWQMDLIDFTKLQKKNDDYSYILVAIDIFTKFVWTVAVPKKTAANMKVAIEKIIKSSPYGAPRNIHSDEGREFTNKTCKALYKKYGINFYQTYSTMKASIVERVIRTLKQQIYIYFTAQHHKKWLNIYQKVTAQYNNTVHHATNMKPKDVKTEKDVEKIKAFMFDRLRKKRVEPKLKVGDYVRISKYKSIFAKGYTANWTTEIFEIVNVFPGTPPTYVLKDADDEEIVGRFYPEELQKTEFPDIYLLEKVIKKTKKTAIVKFLGFDKPEEVPLSALPKNL